MLGSAVVDIACGELKFISSKPQQTKKHSNINAEEGMAIQGKKPSKSKSKSKAANNKQVSKDHLDQGFSKCERVPCLHDM